MQNFVWFQGVIEDRNDPLKIGRVKIRCYGYHTENKQDLPTEDLPWATPITPVTSASVNGIGETPLGPVTGTWVVGFLEMVALHKTLSILELSPQSQVCFQIQILVLVIRVVYIQKKTSLTNPIQAVLARNEKIEETIVEKRNDIDEMEVPSGGGSSSQITSQQHLTTHSIHSTK